MDFPHWWERENEPNVFFWLVGDGGRASERRTLSTWSHCTVQCVELRTYTLTHALLSFSPVPVCTSPACRADLDLDYDSYHEDYYDRYCHPAPHTHFMLLVCVSNWAQEDSSSLLPPLVSAAWCVAVICSAKQPHMKPGQTAASIFYVEFLTPSVRALNFYCTTFHL